MSDWQRDGDAAQDRRDRERDDSHHQHPAPPLVGSRIHGFANGVFGRDSYTCRTVEAVGLDWVVTRNDRREVEFATLAHFQRIEDAEDRTYCDCPPGD